MELRCEVVEIKIEKHPNADALELGRVGDYLSVVQKGVYSTGDKVVYIPEVAVLPESLIEEMGLVGRLAGRNKNRVKAIKLRKVLSQGLIYPLKEDLPVGTCVKEKLGIVKWEPPIPVELQGSVDTVAYQYSSEPNNIKKYPDILKDGEMVYMTEKIHGTFCKVTYMPPELRKENMVDGKFAVSSKSLAHKGIYFQDVPANEMNAYIRAVKNSGVLKGLENYVSEYRIQGPVSLVGEVFGKIQDLRYNIPTDVDFRAFSIKRLEGHLGYNDFVDVSNFYNIPMVPILYHGPYSKEVLLEHTTGREQVSGKESCIREGLVVYPENHRSDDIVGRVFFKSISDKYLTRKGDITEFN